MDLRCQVLAGAREEPPRVARFLISGAGPLTLDLGLGGLDVGQHAGHVDAVAVQVLQEDVGVPPGQRTGLQVTQGSEVTWEREVVREVTKAEGEKESETSV